MPRFKKIPVVIEATRITRPVSIKTLEGTMEGNVGDWLITGVNGEQYPCKDDIFRKTYDPVDDQGQAMLNRVFPIDNEEKEHKNKLCEDDAISKES